MEELSKNKTKNKTPEPPSEIPEKFETFAIVVESASIFVATVLSYLGLVLEFATVVWKSLFKEKNPVILRYLHLNISTDIMTIHIYGYPDTYETCEFPNLSISLVQKCTTYLLLKV